MRGRHRLGDFALRGTFSSSSQRCSVLLSPARLISSSSSCPRSLPRVTTSLPLIRSSATIITSTRSSLPSLVCVRSYCDAAAKAAYVDDYLKQHTPYDAMELVSSIRRKNEIEPDHALYSAMARVCAKNHNFSLLHQIVTEMHEKGMPPLAVPDCTEIFKAAKSRSDLTTLNALKEIYRIGKLVGDQEFYYQLMRAYLRLSKPSTAIYIFGKVERITRTIKLDTRSYAALLEAFGWVERKDLAARWLVRIKNRGVPYDTTLMNGYIVSLGAARDINTAVSTFQDMEHKKYPEPSKESYDALVRVAILSEKPETAWGIIRKMKEKGFTPTAETYNMIIKGCLRLRRMKEVDGVLTRMAEEGISPDIDTYHMVLALCAEEKDVNKAEEVCKVMQEKGFPLDIDVFSSLISTCHQYAKALRAGDPYNPDLDKQVKQLSDRAYTYYNEMVKRKVMPSGDLYRAIFDLTSQAKDMNRALNYYDDMKRHGLVPDETIVKAVAAISYGQMVRNSLVTRIVRKKGEPRRKRPQTCL